MVEITTRTGYLHRCVYDKTRNVAVHEIKKSTSDLPYTVIIYEFSRYGHRNLFNDLYWADSWDETRGSDGKASDDVIFCINLWKELGLEEQWGPFHPKMIEHDLARWPTVYRRGLEEVMGRVFGTSELEIK
jgi:hypothetical protein